MPTPSYTVAQAAALAGVSPTSVRNWCAQFAQYLSSSAAPPAGTERMLTPADVATLQQIAQWRQQRMGYDSIALQLAELPTEELQITIDAQPVQETTALQQPTSEVVTAVTLIEAIDARYSRLEVRLIEVERRQVSGATTFGWGFIAGLAVALLVFVAILMTR